MVDFREALTNRAKVEAMNSRDPRADYPYIYQVHLEEVFSALIRAVQEVDPEARLVYAGSNMGGPLWDVKFSKDVNNER